MLPVLLGDRNKQLHIHIHKGLYLFLLFINIFKKIVYPMLPVSGLSIFACPFRYSLTLIEQHESLIKGGMKPGDFSTIIQLYRIYETY